jgi:CRISPR/Cas system CSM-associated protein Csm3 (group 7 of RAMP superfamily)
MWFELIGPITDMESIATGSALREIQRLRKHYGRGSWKKRKGIGTVRLHDGTICRAELHWYEAHGVGRKEMKIKHLLE